MVTLDERYTEIRKLTQAGDLNQATARLQDLARDFQPEPAAFATTTRLRRAYNLHRAGVAKPGALSLDEIAQNTLASSEAIHQHALSKPPPVALTDLVCVTDNVQKRYKRGTRFHLQAQNLSVRFGEITAMVGENGNGKSSLIKILAGELANTGGSVTYPYIKFINGAKPLDLYAIKRKISYVSQELPKWTGSTRNNLLFTGAAHGLKPDANVAEVEFIISRLGLDAYTNASWSQLSGGYKMRFSLARALISNPHLLLLDEPLASLDVNTQLMFLQDLRNMADSLARPLSIVVSSQHLHEIESIADKLLFLKQGKTVYYGARASFGTERKENVFELTCGMSAAELAQLLQHVPDARIDPVGANFMIKAPVSFTTHDLLSLLVAQRVNVTYFRDISQSTRKLFELGDTQ